MVNLLPIHATGVLQERYLRAIFRSLIDDRNVQVDNYFTDDSALVAAESFLLRHPDRHVAVVLETWSEHPEKIRKVYDDGCHRIEQASHHASGGTSPWPSRT